MLFLRGSAFLRKRHSPAPPLQNLFENFYMARAKRTGDSSGRSVQPKVPAARRGEPSSRAASQVLVPPSFAAAPRTRFSGLSLAKTHSPKGFWRLPHSKTFLRIFIWLAQRKKAASHTMLPALYGCPFCTVARFVAVFRFAPADKSHEKFFGVGRGEGTFLQKVPSPQSSFSIVFYCSYQQKVSR